MLEILEIIEEEDAAIIDESLTLLSNLLLYRGITLKQKRGYKAGKLTRTRKLWRYLRPTDTVIQITRL